MCFCQHFALVTVLGLEGSFAEYLDVEKRARPDRVRKLLFKFFPVLLKGFS